MFPSRCWLAIALSINTCLSIGCEGPDSPVANEMPASDPKVHPRSAASAEPILRRASGACLATISRLEEHDDRPSDGDHRIEAWLKVEESSGAVPEFIRLVIDSGGSFTIEGNESLEDRQAKMVLRPDSLRKGERHWFLFSEDYDSSKYPHQIAGWWPYNDGNVPHDVVEAVQEDRFADHPVWDKTLNAVYSWQQTGDEIRIRVREADSLAESAVLFDETMQGKLESLIITHWATTYEMEWPPEDKSHFVQVATVGDLPAGNEFELPAGKYRLMVAFELQSGKKVAMWVAKNQEVWLMHAYRQYDLDTGKPTISMQFDLLDAGGINAGGDTENWYRRIVKRFDGGQLRSEQVFRHPHIKTGTERIYSGSGWLPVAAASEIQ